MSAELFLALLACHWAGDFTHLSRPWMLAAKANGTPLTPIMAHAGVHAALMLGVLLLMAPAAALAGTLIQLSTHFGIDVLKGRMNVWFPGLRDPKNYFHWWVFGADQVLHVSVILLIVLRSA